MQRKAGIALAVAAITTALAPGVVDARVRKAQSVLPPGQSGFVSLTGLPNGEGSPHLQDQTPLFLRHKMKTFMFDPPAAATESPRAGVTIERDKYGVPEITGKTQDDMWFGAGYAMAQDRLFQLELFRRATTGHLAEIVGPSYVDDDLIVRRDFYTPAERQAQLDKLPANLRARFQGIADGINAWIEETRSDPSKLPGEFAAVGTTPSDWKVLDSVAIGIYLARTVPSDDGEEINNMRALRELGPKLFDKLLAIRAKKQMTTVPKSEGSFPSQPGRTRAQERAGFARSVKLMGSLPIPDKDSTGDTNGQTVESSSAPSLLGRLGSPGGSNMWAIRSKDRKRTTFWNGPQLGFQIPELFVELELRGPGYHARGATAPGVPVLGLGHNDHVAWGVTSGLTDDDDLFAVKLAGPESYRFRGKTRAMSCRDETITWKSPPSDLLGVPPSELPSTGSRTFRLCRTSHGPVQKRAGSYAFARRYAIWGREVGTLEGLSEVNVASSVKQVDAATHKLTWNENLMAADDKGHIGYWHPGLLQIKPRNFDERLPYPGNGNAEWRGFLTPKQRPHVVDPKQGFLVNWNNMPSAGWTQGDVPARERLLGRFHRAAVLRRDVKEVIRNGGGFRRTKLVDEYAGTHAQQRVLLDDRLRQIRKGATGQAAKVLDTILDWGGDYDRTNSNGTVRPGVATWRKFMQIVAERRFGKFTGEGAESVFDTRGSSHRFESTLGEVYALRTLPRKQLHAAALETYAALLERFESSDPAKWREPRTMYEPGSQGAASMPDIPFFDRGTFEEAVELGP